MGVFACVRVCVYEGMTGRVWLGGCAPEGLHFLPARLAE